MAVVNEVMLMGEQATRDYMLTADLEALKKTPRMVTEKELAPEVQAAYVAGYHNGSLDVAIEALDVINKVNNRAAQAAPEVKVYEMPPTKKSVYIGKKLIGLGLVIGAGVYLYKQYKKNKPADIDEYDDRDDFFDDDESERPEE